MLKNTKGKIVLTLTVVLAASSVIAVAGKAASTQRADNLFKSVGTEKLLYCEVDSSQYSERHT